MKKIIIGLLARGYTTTKKYTLDDLTRAFYPLNHIVKVNELGWIRCNSNSFWKHTNNINRCELIADLATAKLGDIKSNLYHILNRYENGDHYGIERNEKQ